MRSLLFIGGTGFLGQSFFENLNLNKLRKLNLSKIIIISRKKKEIKSKNKIKLSFINKNISKLKKIPVTDYVIYAANSNNNKDNLKGVYNFSKLLNFRHRNTKILFTSSGAVYGNRNYKKKMKESDLVNLINVKKFSGYKKDYARSKILMEREFIKISKRNFNVSIARLFSFIGKKILINKSFAITDLIYQAKDKKTNQIKINDNKNVYRGYMDSSDLIEWLIKILINSSKKCDIYNVGSSKPITIKNLANILAKKFKKRVVINNNIKSSKIMKDIDYYVPSILKAKKKLKLELKFNIHKSINSLLKN